MKLSDVISQTVNSTIKQLKREGMIQSYKMDSFKKVEKLLFEYPKMNPVTEEGKDLIKRIQTALESIKDDPYYELINLRYFNGMTYEKLCEHFGVERNTIQYHRVRLINSIKTFIVPDDVIKEIQEL